MMDRIAGQIEKIWKSSGAWDEYKDLMRQALNPDTSAGDGTIKSPSRWARLPGLCCQAAGEDPHLADPLAAAWLLLYIAADTMDDVEDLDEKDAWWSDIGPGAAVNAATGLYFTAANLLWELEKTGVERERVRGIVQDLYNSFLIICSGQHFDLVTPQPGLAGWWEIATAKSGTFFSAACRAGAALAGADTDTCQKYSNFGKHIGILTQVLDDLGDLKHLRRRDSFSSLDVYNRSLPVIYSYEMGSDNDREKLQGWLKIACEDHIAAEKAFQFIEKCGTELYLMTEIERHQNMARTELKKAGPESSAEIELFSLVDSLSYPTN